MYSNFRSLLILHIFLVISFSQSFSQVHKILESTVDHIKVEFDFSDAYSIHDTLIDGRKFQVIAGNENYYRDPGDPWLPMININLGIPHKSSPTFKILHSDKNSYSNRLIMPFPETDPLFERPDVNKINMEIYSNNQFFPFEIVQLSSSFIFRYSNILPVSISPFQFNPVTRELVFNRTILIRIDYNISSAGNRVSITDAMTNSYLESAVINFNQARNWVSKQILNGDSPLEDSSSWYDPNKNYYKFYLKEKGVYRVAYNNLISAGVPLGSNTAIDKLELFNRGVSVPMDLVDANNDQLFNGNDYIQFVGFPPPSSPNTYLNIYNLSNIYWFSYESDSTGNTYSHKDAYPHFWVNSFATVSHTLHYEIDTLYERLGHAGNDQRDYWYWGTTSGVNGTLTKLFTGVFPFPENLSPQATSLNISVKMHGMTTSANCPLDHKVKVSLTSQLIGEHTWDGPNETTFSTTVDLSQVSIYPSNNFQVAAFGDICPGESDEIRINWFEIEYPRDLRADDNNISFKSIKNENGETRFQVFNWQRDNIKIFVPGHNEMLINPLIANDPFKSVFFVDDIFERTEYFCSSDDFFLQVDSIVQDQPSNLSDISNGADYIIITHSKFSDIADQLADFRMSNFPDENITNPRILFTDVQQIYDEFSYGLLDPYALQSFVKYTFESWQQPAPSYVVLLGDMSYDYRELIEGSRPNFVPSIPFHSSPYGQAAGDNLIVSVAGNDLAPDIAIGRLSVETIEEANILLNKLINYPDDDSKKWKQNALLVSSGLNLNDETTFGFNDANLYLDDTFLVPTGISSTKVFRYPHKPRHYPFQGEGPEIRQGFDDGAVVASYYGHGGGLQWDLVFTTDDIHQLQNGGRLPFISSVTCYTAHFDNQDVFGEIFNKAEGKGSIGFYGSSGLTYWGIGKAMNQELFNEIFIQKDYVIGRAILISKNQFPPGGLYGHQMALLTYLGDPVLKLAIPDKPDFEILSSDISIDPQVVLVDDDVKVKAKLKNYGIIFPGDSVVVQIFATSTDTSYTVDELKIGSFGETDSILVNWVPAKKGLYEITVRINAVEVIPEMDHTDNQASIFVVVFDLGEPSILEPINGFVSSDSTVNFLFVDNGIYVFKNLRYLIQIDTSVSFEQPLVESPYITPQGGLLQWESPALTEGVYFWRARIISEEDSTVWDTPKVLNIDYNSNETGYLVKEEGLSLLNVNNVNYSDSLKSLILNINPLPPRPTDNTFIEFLNFSLPPDLSGVTSITSDGKYIYYSHLTYYMLGEQSKIYRLGTGYNGTIKGENYGPIPDVEVSIWDQLFYFPDNEGGHIYVANGDPYSLTKVNPENGEISSVEIPDGMLNLLDGQVHSGAFYITSNGQYVYNIASRNELGEYKYTIRTFDPLNGWAKVGDDLIPAGESYAAFTNFFVADNYLYPYERLYQGYIRRINLNNGAFEEQWHSSIPFQDYYAWTYDWVNDRVYASVFTGNNQPTKIAVFRGTYTDANGSIISHQVGPSAEWNSLEYIVDDIGSAGSYQTYLKGFNKNTNLWETLIVNPLPQIILSSIKASEYPYLQLHFSLVDTSFGATESIKLKSINISYETPSEIMITDESIVFTPDTILQGFDTELSSRILNIGNSQSEEIRLDYYFNAEKDSSGDSSFISRNISIPGKGYLDLYDTLSTSSMLFDNSVRIVVEYSGIEYFTFNNLSEKSFFVARDSIKPTFSVTFDGREIINGDIVSAKPDVKIILEDNSPLPLDTSFFTIVYDNKLLYFAQPDLSYEISEYPNSRMEIHWTPELHDGDHKLDILAKDASGNFFDSTASSTRFSVFNESDLTEVYNYPNPFTDKTHFTFRLRGTEKPEEIIIKVYTIAGRLIRDIKIPGTDPRITIGFNKIFWDGKDQDGDEIANGVYLYKMIAKFSDKTKSVTQKLARVQ
jgi:hypothetical protein